MERLIIGVTFFLGVGLILVAVVALFRKGRTAGGSLELPGIKLTANSAPALFLVVGAAMILSGFAWASTDKKRVEAVKDKTEVVRETAQLHDSYIKQVELSRSLLARVNPSVVNELPPDKRALIAAPVVTLSPKVRAEITRLP